MEDFKKTTDKLLKYYLLFQTIFGILYEIIINNVPDTITQSFINVGVIIVISKLIIELLSWYLARNSAIKDKILKPRDIKTLMRKMYGYAIGVCILLILLNFQDIKAGLDDSFNNSNELKMYNMYAETYLSEEEFEIYNNELNKKIKEVKKEVYTYCSIIYLLMIGCTILAVRMQNKPLQKLVEEECYSESLQHVENKP